MMKREEITDKEFSDYTTRLIPKLRQQPRHKWTQIGTLTDNVPRFIEICQYLANEGHFDDESGYLIIEVWQDSLIRLDATYLMKSK